MAAKTTTSILKVVHLEAKFYAVFIDIVWLKVYTNNILLSFTPYTQREGSGYCKVLNTYIKQGHNCICDILYIQYACSIITYMHTYMHFFCGICETAV